MVMVKCHMGQDQIEYMYVKTLSTTRGPWRNIATLSPLVDERRGLSKVHDTGRWAHTDVKIRFF